MVQNREPNDRNNDISRQLRSFNRRIERLEDTQVTNRELNRGFDKVYEEIDYLEDKIDLLRSDFNDFRKETNNKLDMILSHLTGIDKDDD